MSVYNVSWNPGSKKLVMLIFVCFAAFVMLTSGCVTIVSKYDKVDGGFVPISENVYAYVNQEQPAIVIKRSEDSGYLLKGIWDTQILGEWNLRGSQHLVSITRSDNKSYITFDGAEFELYHTPFTGIYAVIDENQNYIGTLTITNWIDENSFGATFEDGTTVEQWILVKQDIEGQHS